MYNPNYPFDLPLLTTDSDWLEERHYTGVLKRASVELAELKGYCRAVPNPLLLLSPAIIKESLASSAIENIHTSVESVMRNQLLHDEKRLGPDKEVLRYREAILWGLEHMDSLSLSTRLIVGIANQITMGRYNEIRTMPNAIVDGKGTRVYTPPVAHQIPTLLSNWERFVNQNDDGLDPLIKAAVAHYQFEAIHPFGDGNGRTGRILLVLSLVQSGVLTLPVIYISGYINEHKSDYYRLLRQVTEANDWIPYITYILHGLERQAKQTKEILLGMMELFQDLKTEIRTHYKDFYTSELIECLFESPIITASVLAKKLNVHRSTATNYLLNLHKGGTLELMTIGRNHFYVNRRLLTTLEKF